MIRLAQTYSEEQGRDQATINDALEERLAILEQQVDAAAACAASNGGVGISVDRHSGQGPVSPAPPPAGLCGINTAGLSEWMTGVDKQLHDLHGLTSAGIPAGGSSGDHWGETESIRQHQAAAKEAGKGTAAVTHQQAAQDYEYARMEERVSRLEETLPEKTVDNDAEGPAGAAKSGRGRRPSPNPTHTPPPPSPPPLGIPPPLLRSSPPQEAVPAAGEVGSDTRLLLDAVEEGTTVARKASELAQEALQAGKEAIERSERTGKPTGSGGSRCAPLCVCVCV